jgi:hypothetical protein
MSQKCCSRCNKPPLPQDNPCTTDCVADDFTELKHHKNLHECSHCNVNKAYCACYWVNDKKAESQYCLCDITPLHKWGPQNLHPRADYYYDSD